MISLKKIDKFELGKYLIPTKVFKFKYKEKIINLFKILNDDNFNYLIITDIFILSIFLSFLTYLIIYNKLYILLYSYLSKNSFIRFIVIFLTYYIINFLIYILLLISYVIYKNNQYEKKVYNLEKSLPDFLDNLVSNLKGGIPIEKALLKSVRPDQKDLLKEVTLMNEKIMMGFSIDKVISDFRDRFKESPIIARTFFLIEEGLKGGSNLSKPLETISKNLKNLYTLNEEIEANGSGIAFLIKSISLVVSPLLFALALTLLTFLNHLFTMFSKNKNINTNFRPLPPEFILYLKDFSIAMIVLIVIFSTLISAQLRNKNKLSSLKTLPINLTISLVLYIELSKLLLSLFQSIF